MNPNEKVICLKRKKTRYDNFGSIAKRVAEINGLIDINGNAYGLEFHKSLSDNDLCIQTRGVAEDNEKYKQFIVQAYVRNKSNTKAVLLRRLADNMLTPIQGHAGLPDGIDVYNEHSYLDLDSLYNNLYYNVCKETREEVTGVMPLINMHPDKFHFAYFMNDDINSRYHVGCTFKLVIDDDVLDRALPSITSGEPEKHKVEIVDLTRIDTYEPIDPWLRALLDMERVY